MPSESFDLLELVETLAKQMAPMATDKGLQITAFLEPQLPRIWHGDRQSIAVILRLLLESSIKQTPSGATVVEVLEMLCSPHNRLKFAVTDSRTELDHEALTALKEQLLAHPVLEPTVEESLARLGTKLEIDDRVIGRATRFFFSARLEPANVSCIDLPMGEELQRTRFFIVANDPYPNRTIQRYCLHQGLHVEGAPTASEGLTALGLAALTDPFDILAVAPPIEDMNHLEVAAAIRASDHLAGTKLLYVAPSSITTDKERAELRDAGFDASLEKPFTKQELFGSLSQLVGLEKPARVKPVVLIVDDNPVNLKVAIFQTRQLGFEAVVAHNGMEAVDSIEHGTFFAVLMDLQMPVMDGIEATRRIRAREAKTGGHIPVIALTANEDMKQVAMAAGCDDFLVKPASKDQLNTALSRYVQIGAQGCNANPS
jgi:two-component system, sensor histidine kinase and response regulator